MNTETNNSNLEHSHYFEYRISRSTVDEISPHTIRFEIDGDVSLPEILEKFEAYLKAVGYVPPENSYLDFTQD